MTALLAHAERRLEELDAVADRIDDASYGFCEVCGGPIGAERLEAVPTTRRCVACAAARPRTGWR